MNIEYPTGNVEYPRGFSISGWAARKRHGTRENEYRIIEKEFRIVRCRGVLISRTG
jgi:hypothetical protein